MSDAERILEKHGVALKKITNAIYRRYGARDRTVDAEDVYQECALALLAVVEKSSVAESDAGFYRCVYAASKRRVYQLTGLTARDPARTGRLWRRGLHGDAVSLNESLFDDKELLERLQDPAPAVEAELDAACLCEDVRRGMADLPEAQRALVSGVFLEGASLPGVAATLGMTSAQARKALNSALDAMKRSPWLACYGETARHVRRRIR